MKHDLENILEKIMPFLKKLHRYRILILLVAIASIYSFMIIRINVLNSQEPSDEAVSAKLQTVSRPKIDQETIDKIKQLQDNSVDVKALFNNARDNPFQE